MLLAPCHARCHLGKETALNKHRQVEEGRHRHGAVSQQNVVMPQGQFQERALFCLNKNFVELTSVNVKKQEELTFTKCREAGLDGIGKAIKASKGLSFKVLFSADTHASNFPL